MKIGLARVFLLILSLAGTASAGASEVEFVSANGTRLAYVEAGQGDPLVLVHGGMQDYRFWQSHLGYFGKHYRTIAYSRRNHFPNAVSVDGASDRMGDLHGEDLAGVIEKLSSGPVHVVAHSGGALAALFLAASHPALVRTLVVNEPPATSLLLNAAGGKELLAEFGARLNPAREAFRLGDVEQGARMFADAVGGAGTYERRSAFDRRMMLDNSEERVADARTSAKPEPFTCEMAKRITAPTLVMNGARSPVVFHRIAEELERCVPNAQRVVIPDASHTVPGENPARFQEAVRAFLLKH